MMSLFKMVPLIEGEIILDGVNIECIPLQHLRSKVSIVPQDIILFNGTIRLVIGKMCNKDSYRPTIRLCCIDELPQIQKFQAKFRLEMQIFR